MTHGLGVWITDPVAKACVTPFHDMDGIHDIDKDGPRDEVTNPL